MNNQIIKDILFLKERYTYHSNIYKIEFLINENNFKNILQNIINENKNHINDIKIIDAKYYHDKNFILEILDNGIMNCLNIKKLKYINYKNNVKLHLYSERKNYISNFSFKQNYEKIYKMKKIVFNIDNNLIEFNVVVDENDNKNKIFNINYIIYSFNKNIINILNLLNKND